MNVWSPISIRPLCRSQFDRTTVRRGSRHDNDQLASRSHEGARHAHGKRHARFANSRTGRSGWSRHRDLVISDEGGATNVTSGLEGGLTTCRPCTCAPGRSPCRLGTYFWAMTSWRRLAAPAIATPPSGRCSSLERSLVALESSARGDRIVQHDAQNRSTSSEDREALHHRRGWSCSTRPHR